MVDKACRNCDEMMFGVHFNIKDCPDSIMKAK